MRISMRTLTALLLTDGRPGHYHLSEGVIAAVRRLRDVDVVRLPVRRRGSGRLVALLSNTGCPAEWLLRLIYGLAPSQIPSADFIVSAGAETLGASIAMARLTGAPNIFCGTLRRYRPDGLSLVLTSYASHARRPRHVMVLKPCALSRKDVARFPTRLAGAAVPRTMGLLLGGQSGECRYDTDEWEQLLDFAERSYQTLGIRWVVSNSRRTPQAVSEMVAARVAAGSGSIASFIDVRITGPGTLGRVLERVEAVVCTDDSSTMISECVSAGLPVLGARPRRAKFTPDEQSYRAYLIGNGWHRSVPIAGLAPDALLNEMARIRPLTDNPLDHLASVIRERIPELFSAYPAPTTHSDQRASRRAESRSSRRTSTLSPA